MKSPNWLIPWIAPVVAVACLASSVFSLDRWQHGAGDPSRFLSVPPRALVAHATGGFRDVTADLLFLRFVDYWGYRLVHGRDFQNLEPILQEVTGLDPRYGSAWDVGSLALADAGDIDGMRAYLERGAHLHPRDPWFPYHEGLLTFLFSDRYVTAGHDFERAAALPGAPRASLFFAARMFAKANQRELAIATWRQILAHDDSSQVRKVATRALARLGVELPPGG